MIINANTKIASILKHNSEALEAIVSISPKFTKLRNPLLRKVIAARASISMASKIGGCTVDDFFNKLQPFGFIIDNSMIEIKMENQVMPDFMRNISVDKLVDLDVRTVIETGKDPLNIIVKNLKSLKSGFVLKIINSFEPTPLIHLLKKQGYESYTERINNELVHTYFYKKDDIMTPWENKETGYSIGYNEILNRFSNMLVTIDVRSLEMPLPMHVILEALETLPEQKALFVYHKRIPVFLIPELEDQLFSYRIMEISDEEVHMLIYKD